VDGARAHPAAHQFRATQKVHKGGWAAAAGAKALAPCLVATRLITERCSEQSRRTLWRLDTEGNRMQPADGLVGRYNAIKGSTVGIHVKTRFSH
jgi:hypothetical protein